MISIILDISIGSRILGIFPINAKSIFGFNKAVMESLAGVGHQVTLVSPFAPTRPHQNITFIDSRKNKVETPSPWFSHDFKTMHWLQNAKLVADFMENDCYDVMKIPEIRVSFLIPNLGSISPTWHAISS